MRLNNNQMPSFKISRAEGVAETDPVGIAVAAAVEYSVAPFVEVVEAVEAGVHLVDFALARLVAVG